MANAHFRAMAGKLSSLYVVNKTSYIEQYRIGKQVAYRTVHSPLTENILVDHLKLKKTIGVTTDPNTKLTSFMCFDVDSKKDSERDTILLVKLLNEYYGIEEKDIHVSFSGMKGYHVELFFDEAIQYSRLIPFYEEVLLKLGTKKERVELRPIGVGIKLPLSLHRRTDKFSSYCLFKYNYNMIENMGQDDCYNHLMNIKPMNTTEFKEFVLDEVDIFSLEKPKAIDFVDLTSNMNFTGRLDGDQINELEEVLALGRLKFSGTRNRISWLLPIYLKEKGFSLEESEQVVLNVLLNTFDNYREFISSETDRETVINEVVRLNNQSFKKNYQLKDGKRSVTINKAEVNMILSIKELHLKKLILSLLIQSKRYADDQGSFYTSYSTIIKYGNFSIGSNRSRILNYLMKLEQKGYIEIVQRNQIDIVRTKAEKSVIKEPNKYKVNVPIPNNSDEATELVLSSDQVVELKSVITYFFDKKEARKILPRRQYEKFYK